MMSSDNNNNDKMVIPIAREADVDEVARVDGFAGGPTIVFGKSEEDDGKMLAQIELGNVPVDSVEVQYDAEHHGLAVRCRNKREERTDNMFKSCSYSFSSYETLPGGYEVDEGAVCGYHDGKLVLPLKPSDSM